MTPSIISERKFGVVVHACRIIADDVEVPFFNDDFTEYKLYVTFPDEERGMFM